MTETITINKIEFENILNEINFIKKNYVSKKELNILENNKEENLFEAFTKAGEDKDIEEYFPAQQEILKNE